MGVFGRVYVPRCAKVGGSGNDAVVRRIIVS